ncbi:hypothetical protein QFZ98_004381 [Paraburkholderia youngii]
MSVLVGLSLLLRQNRVKQLQDVIEDCMQRQGWSRPTSATAQIRQDKLLKLLKTQIRGNRLPVLTSGHPLHPQIRTLTDLTMRTLKVSPHAACRQIYAHQKTRNQL